MNKYNRECAEIFELNSKVQGLEAQLATAKADLALETSRAEAALRIAETANKGFEMCGKELREAKADVKELVGWLDASFVGPCGRGDNGGWRKELADRIDSLKAKHTDGRAQ
jgi:adenylosuccinate lyase